MELRHWLDHELVKLSEQEGAAADLMEETELSEPSSPPAPRAPFLPSGGSADFASEACAAVLAGAASRREATHTVVGRQALSDYVASIVASGGNPNRPPEAPIPVDGSGITAAVLGDDILSLLSLPVEVDGYVATNQLLQQEQLLNACMFEIVGCECASLCHGIS